MLKSLDNETKIALLERRIQILRARGEIMNEHLINSLKREIRCLKKGEQDEI